MKKSHKPIKINTNETIILISILHNKCNAFHINNLIDVIINLMINISTNFS